MVGRETVDLVKGFTSIDLVHTLCKVKHTLEPILTEHETLIFIVKLFSVLGHVLQVTTFQQ